MKRTNTIYFDKTINKFIIDKERLSLSEVALLKNNPDKYTTEKPKSEVIDEHMDEENDIDYEKKLQKEEKKRKKKEEKYKRKQDENFWKFYEKYKKNPKKYSKGLTKTERDILKYFNKNRKNKKKKLSKEEKELKKLRKDPLQLTLYLKDKHMEEEYELQSELRTGIPFRHKKKKNCFFTYGNPNKGFANNNVRDYDKEQIALLENLENEIIERLNSPELFTEGITVIDHSGSKYKKKHKKKDLTRLMI